MKSWRQSQILELIDREPMSSQQGLRQKLLEKGITATQATVSRDLKELGLVKRAGDGAYVRPGTEQGSPALYVTRFASPGMPNSAHHDHRISTVNCS